MQLLYCWRCQCEIPMLDEDEWASIAAIMQSCLGNLHRADTGKSLAETPLAEIYRPALDEYARITDFRETNPNALFHHRVSLYGPPCSTCGKPLRTPSATQCVECGPRKGAD